MMDHFTKMAKAEYMEGRLRDSMNDHDEVSTLDAEATEMRDKRNKEGVKLSPTPEAQRHRERGEKRKAQEEPAKSNKGMSGRDHRDAEGSRRHRREEDVKTTRSRSRRRQREVAREKQRSRSRRRRSREREQDLRWKPGEGKYGVLKQDKKGLAQ